MLDVNPDTVCRLIELAREFHAQGQVIISEEPAGLADDRLAGLMAIHGEDPTLGEFRSIVEDLEPRQQQQVVGLMWIGRGDYDFAEWKQALEHARDEWTDYTADYLLAHPLLADYLTDGLDLHGHRCD